MTPFSARQVLAVWLILILSLPGCWTGKGSRPFRDPTFTRATARNGGLVVIGVVSRVGDQIERERWRDELAGLLAESLTRREPMMVTVPNQVVDSLLGTEQLAALLDRFGGEPVVRADGIPELAAALNHRVRYALFAAVVDEKVWQFTGWPDEPGPPRQGVPKMRENVTRLDVYVVGVVYDLESGLEVWRGEVMGFARRASAPFDPDKRSPSYPPPPTLLEVVPEAFTKLADLLFE